MARGSQVDFRIHDAEGRLLAVAEAKRRVGVDRRWAEETKGLLLSGRLAPARFFLLITVDRIFLWDERDRPESPVEIDAGPLFAELFERSNTRPEEISPEVFELFAHVWLREFFRNRELQALPEARKLAPLFAELESPEDVEVQWAA
jgi:hypothetical protein